MRLLIVTAITMLMLMSGAFAPNQYLGGCTERARCCGKA